MELNGLGGPGFPRPEVPGIDVGKAVDLGMLKNKDQHGHRWVMVARFAIDDETVSIMLANEEAFRQAAGAGREMSAVNVQLDMSDRSMVAMDGPGCLKCGVPFNVQPMRDAPCPVADGELAAAGITWPFDKVVEAEVVEAAEVEVVERPKLTVVERGI